MIKTKRKKIFLHKEYKMFCFKDYKEFCDVMQSDVKTCGKCGILYWDGCIKRCDCENKVK